MIPAPLTVSQYLTTHVTRPPNAPVLNWPKTRLTASASLHNHHFAAALFIPATDSLTAHLRLDPTHTAYSDTDTHHSFPGLQHQLVGYTPRYRLPTMIVDNHHVAYWGLDWAQRTNFWPTAPDLCHFDAHWDKTPAPLLPAPPTAEAAWHFTIQHLTVANYLEAAQRHRRLTNIYYYVESPHFTTPPPPPRFILNLDLDLFHTDMGHLPWDQVLSQLATSLSTCAGLLLATSPGFIAPERALAYAQAIITAL